MENAITPTTDPVWVIHEHGCDPLRERGVESRFAISNGFLGVRAVPTMGGERVCVCWPHTYVAGLFDIPDIPPRIPALVSAPDWIGVTLLVDGEPLLRSPSDMVSYRRTLDMKRGAFLSTWHPPEAGGTIVRVRELRLVSLVDRGTGLQILSVELDGQAELTMEVSCVVTDSALEPQFVAGDLGVWRIGKSGKSLAVATATALRPLRRCNSTASICRRSRSTNLNRSGDGNPCLARPYISKGWLASRGVTTTATIPYLSRKTNSRQGDSLAGAQLYTATRLVGTNVGVAATSQFKVTRQHNRHSASRPII